MKEKYLKINRLSVSRNLANFINKELLPGTSINKKKFWKNFDKTIHELSRKIENYFKKERDYKKQLMLYI